MSQKQTQPPVEKCHQNCPYCSWNSYTSHRLFDNSLNDSQQTHDVLNMLAKCCICNFRVCVGLNDSLVLAFCPSHTYTNEGQLICVWTTATHRLGDKSLITESWRRDQSVCTLTHKTHTHSPTVMTVLCWGRPTQVTTKSLCLQPLLHHRDITQRKGRHRHL